MKWLVLAWCLVSAGWSQCEVLRTARAKLVMDTVRGTPLYSVHSAKTIDGGFSRVSWHNRAPCSIYLKDQEGYTGTFFDKSHLIPHEDISDDSVLVDITGSYVNAVPLHRGLNRGVLSSSENLARKIQATVITIPVYSEASTDLKGNPVPTVFVKILISGNKSTSFVFFNTDYENGFDICDQSLSVQNTARLLSGWGVVTNQLLLPNMPAGVDISIDACAEFRQ